MTSELSSDRLILELDGLRHSGWTELTLIRSIERGPHEFDLRLTERWSTGQQQTTPRTLRVGMSAAVTLVGNDEQLLSHGYLDDVDPEYDATRHSIRARGRSKLGDLVDCSLPDRQFPGQSLRTIATTLCQPFGIAVEVDPAIAAEAAAPFKGETLGAGQPIWEFLEQLARIRAVLLVSTPQGNLRITRAGSAEADIALVLGQNILRASGKFSHRDRFSEYRVTGQQPQKFGYSVGDTAHPEAVVKGNGRYRPRAIHSDTPADIAACQNRAEWQRNVDYGRSRGVVYTVRGWRQTPGGRVWTPNERIRVTDPWAGIDEQLLITETRLKLDDDLGRHTELRVMPPAAFELRPLPESESDTGAWRLDP